MYCIFKFQHVDAADRNNVHMQPSKATYAISSAPRTNVKSMSEDDDEGDEPVEKKVKSAMSFLMGSDSESDNDDEAPQQPMVDEILELEF